MHPGYQNSARVQRHLGLVPCRPDSLVALGVEEHGQVVLQGQVVEAVDGGVGAVVSLVWWWRGRWDVELEVGVAELEDGAVGVLWRKAFCEDDG